MNATISINNSTVVVYECDNHAKNANATTMQRMPEMSFSESSSTPVTKQQWAAPPIGRNCSTTITVANMKR